MELKQTAEMINSVDYKERFKSEYCQTDICFEKLKAIMDKHNNGTLEFQFTCPPSLFDMQLKAIRDYLSILEVEAVIRGIELEKLA